MHIDTIKCLNPGTYAVVLGEPMPAKEITSLCWKLDALARKARVVLLIFPYGTDISEVKASL